MLTFERISQFPRGTLAHQLADAYSFRSDCRTYWAQDWQEYDDFFFDHPRIADNCGFITVLDGTPVGHITWDPSSAPDLVILGHNCICTEYKGRGLGKAQLQEAIRRIRKAGVRRITVTTNALFLPAQRNYESVGFILQDERANTETPFAGSYIDYELFL